MTAQTPTTTTPEFQQFVDAVAAEVATHGGDEETVTKAVAVHLQAWLDAGVEIPESHRAPHPDHYVMYPLYVAEDESFCVASAVWNVGQETPVHDHGTWGVIGIVSGLEQERKYLPREDGRGALEFLGEGYLEPGDVEVCCTSDRDVHAVSSASDVPCVGIHVYGADIGTLPRRRYDPADGSTTSFVSAWAAPVTS